jgi:hypothetical protein
VNDKKKVLSIQKGKRICDKGRKTVANLPEGFMSNKSADRKPTNKRTCKK